MPLTSDPVAVTSPDGIYVFALSTGGHAFYGRIVSGVWSGWTALQGSFSSDLAAVSSSSGVHVFGRGTDGQIWGGRLNGTTFTPWSPLGGAPRTVAAAATASGVYLFIRNSDGAIWSRRYDGAWGAWQNLGGSFTGVPSAAADIFGNLYVVARNSSGNIHANQLSGTSWTGWQNLLGEHQRVPGRGVGAVVRLGVRPRLRRRAVAREVLVRLGSASSRSAARCPPPTRCTA